MDALRSQVKEDTVLLQTLMREEWDGVVRAYRCLVLFSAADGDAAGGVATIDGVERLDPHRLRRRVVRSRRSRFARKRRDGLRAHPRECFDDDGLVVEARDYSHVRRERVLPPARLF